MSKATIGEGLAVCVDTSAHRTHAWQNSSNAFLAGSKLISNPPTPFCLSICSSAGYGSYTPTPRPKLLCASAEPRAASHSSTLTHIQTHLPPLPHTDTHTDSHVPFRRLSLITPTAGIQHQLQTFSFFYLTWMKLFYIV